MIRFRRPKSSRAGHSVAARIRAAGVLRVVSLPQLGRAVGNTSAAVRSLLFATLLLGAAQQIFVVARNPLLSELGWRTASIPAVQAIGAMAGVLSGALATFVAPRLPLHIAFATCALMQAIGFALQAFSYAPGAFFSGAAVAGLAIQLNSALAPPALKTLTRDDERVAVFSLHAIALTPLAGLIAAAVIFGVTVCVGGALFGHRVSLAIAAAISALAAAAFLSMRGGRVQPRGPSGRMARPRRVAFCVGFQGLLGLAGGITVPFLQLYFKVTFGVPLQGIAFLYGATMVVGTVAYALAPWVSQRIGLPRAIVLLQLLTLPFFFELARATNVYLAASAFVARYTLASTASPLLNAFFQEVSFDRDGEAVAGLGIVISSVTWATGTWLASPLLAAGGGRFGYAIAVSALLYVIIAACAAAVFPRLWRGRPRGLPS